MNKEKLLELSDTLREIAEGKEWEYKINNKWLPSQNGYDPVYFANGGLRLKPQPPQPDPYAELKAAHAAGKTIQYHSLYDDTWGDIYNHKDSKEDATWWFADVSRYRIKPEPRKVPLGPGDVMLGCAIRHINQHLPERSVASVDANCVAVSNAHATPSAYDFNHLQKYFQINRSIPLTGKWDKDAWEPCYKLIEE